MPTATWNGAVLAESDETVVVEGQTNGGAAFTYRQPKDAAAEIKDHVAFWKGIDVS